jgi:hypothetical protein
MKSQKENKFQIHTQVFRLNFNFIKSGSSALSHPIMVLGVTNQSNIISKSDNEIKYQIK